MKKVLFATVSILIILIAASLTGCSNATSGNNSPTVIERPSLSDIVGTWKRSGTEPILDISDLDGDGNVSESIGTMTGTNEYVISADSSYIRYSIGEYDFITEPDDVTFAAEKGTITMTHGYWEKTVTAYGSPTSAFQDPATITWNAVDDPSMMSNEICVIDDSFYEYTYRRVGSGSGIVGAWARVHKSRWFADPDWSVGYSKYAYNITSTTITFNLYNSETETFGTPASTLSYTYTLGADGTLTNTTNPETNKVIILGNVFVYADNGYAKQ